MGYYPTWPLGDGWSIRADSAINGGGCRVFRDSGGVAWPVQEVWLGLVPGCPDVPRDHPAVLESARWTAMMDEAQRDAGRTLAAILDAARRWR